MCGGSSRAEEQRQHFMTRRFTFSKFHDEMTKREASYFMDTKKKAEGKGKGFTRFGVHRTTTKEKAKNFAIHFILREPCMIRARAAHW